MSTNNSDSNTSPLASLSRQSESSDEDGSTGSSDFVKVENSDTVAYHPSTASKLPSGEQARSPLACDPLNDVKLVLHLQENAICDVEEEEKSDVDSLNDEEHVSQNTSIDSFAFVSNPNSSFEELKETENERDETLLVEDQRVPMSSASDVDGHVTEPSSLEESAPESAPTESDSDHSDFVRLGPSMIEDTHTDLMHLSNISNDSSAPSLSSSFRFIHRSGMVLGAEEYIKRRFYRDNDADSVSVQSDIDDRCESDISGVADDDMSACSLGDEPISAGNVVRSYKHKPNTNLNSVLTTMALVFLFGAVGVAVGNYMGSLSEAKLRNQQVQKMQTLTDDYLICLQEKDILDETVQLTKHDQLFQRQKHLSGVVAENVVIDSLLTEVDDLKTELKEKMEMENIQSTVVTGMQSEENLLVITELQDAIYILQAENEALQRHDHDDVTKQKMNDKLIEYSRTINDLQHENAALKKSVATFLYTEHPGNRNTAGELESAVDETVAPSGIENLHEDMVVSDEQPEINSDAESAPQQTPEKIQELKLRLTEATEDLEMARGKAEMWHSLFEVEAERAAKAEESVPGLVGCLQLAVPNVSLGELVVMSRDALANVGVFINKQWLMQNMDKDKTFTEALRRKWIDLKALFDTPTVKDASKKAAAIYNDIRTMLADSKLPKFEQSLDANKDAASDNAMPRTGSHFSSAYNKTKETVGILSSRINQTWHKVKDRAKKLAPVIKQKVEIIADRMNSGWKRVNEKITSAWSNNWARKERKRNDQKEEKAEGRTRRRYNDDDTQRQYHGDPYWNVGGSDDEFDSTFTQENDAKNFENKPDHKQKHSEPHLEKKYKKFWSAVGFDLDDISYEGFFEGNDQQLRKHEKKLRKLYGRIQKLNGDVLHDMDDDDIEDLYEDLEDLDEDIDTDIQPQSVKAWLSCQIRWWKSRFQRKHRNEGLIHGCGRQLMEWQIKASCNPKCKGKKDCKRVISDSIICQQLLSEPVIETVAEFDQNQKEINERIEEVKDTSTAEGVNLTRVFSDNYDVPRERKQKVGKKSGRKQLEAEDESPDWLYERAHDLDYRLHKTDWMYERADDRDYHRKRPSDWYHRRTQARQNKHDHVVRKR